MNPDGTGVVRLTHSPSAEDTEPAWSPDGTRIAFTSYPSEGDDGSIFLHVMNADGTGETTISIPLLIAEDPTSLP